MHINKKDQALLAGTGGIRMNLVTVKSLGLVAGELEIMNPAGVVSSNPVADWDYELRECILYSNDSAVRAILKSGQKNRSGWVAYKTIKLVTPGGVAPAGWVEVTYIPNKNLIWDAQGVSLKGAKFDLVKFIGGRVYIPLHHAPDQA